jgi:hypothetical protein
LTRRVLLALAVAGAAAIPATSAQAYQGPCETQRALFEKYNIQIDMKAPLVADAYNAGCSQTGTAETGTSDRKLAVATRSTSVKDIVDDLIVCVREPCP